MEPMNKGLGPTEFLGLRNCKAGVFAMLVMRNRGARAQTGGQSRADLRPAIGRNAGGFLESLIAWPRIGFCPLELMFDFTYKAGLLSNQPLHATMTSSKRWTGISGNKKSLVLPARASLRGRFFRIPQIVLGLWALTISAGVAFGAAESSVAESKTGIASGAAVATVSSLPSTSADGARFSNSPTDQEILVSAVLPQPLAPVDGVSDAGENHALARALVKYQQSLQQGALLDAVGPLTEFLLAHPTSRWRAALDLNLGIIYRRPATCRRRWSRGSTRWDLSKARHRHQGAGDRRLLGGPIGGVRSLPGADGDAGAAAGGS